MKKTAVLMSALAIGCTQSEPNAVEQVMRPLCRMESSACCPTPIILDVAGDGIHLTSWHDGVPFELIPGVSGSIIAWTTPQSDDAWLVLDRNEDGIVNDGSEMFGNFTAQPAPPDGVLENGFAALAVLDSNQDSVVDSLDLKFNDLRLWQDKNHDGRSQTDELSPLRALGVAGISVAYTVTSKVDEHGNRFRYSAAAHAVPGAPVGMVAWDVILTGVKPGSPKARTTSALVATDGASTSKANAPLDTPQASSAVADLLRTWRSEGVGYVEGTLDSPRGQALLRALEGSDPGLPWAARADRSSVHPPPISTDRVLAATGPCMATLKNQAATLTVQQSPTFGIPWGLQLTPANAKYGVVVFKADIFAGGRPADVYQPHTEPWNYHFHGSLPIPFKVKGSNGSYSMKAGDEVYFSFIWTSLVLPGEGGFAMYSCKFTAPRKCVGDE